MGLDISISRVKRNFCQHCGMELYSTVEASESSGGCAWYEWLEKIGYYVPFEKRTEENDWYGKDMRLTLDQVDDMYDFIGKYQPYNADGVAGLIARAVLERNDVIINANW